MTTMAMCALLAVVSELSVSGIPRLHVDTATSTWRDSLNRTMLWHGTNFVEKNFPCVGHSHPPHVDSRALRRCYASIPLPPSHGSHILGKLCMWHGSLYLLRVHPLLFWLPACVCGVHSVGQSRPPWSAFVHNTLKHTTPSHLPAHTCAQLLVPGTTLRWLMPTWISWSPWECQLLGWAS